jgi:D-alanine-D-alanine ligase
MRSKRLRVLALVPEGSTPPSRLAGHTAKEIAGWRMEFDLVRAMRARGHVVTCVEPKGEVDPIRDGVEGGRPHVVFNMLEEFHGFVEFEPNVPALLELLQVPYTGCNPRGLATARDKALTKTILAREGIAVPRFAVFPRGRRFRSPPLPYPVIVKSLTEEASAGLSHGSLVRGEARLRERVAYVHESVASDVIAEEYVPGREISVAVLGNGRPRALPPRELDLSGLPPSAPRFATARVKWDLAYQRRHAIRSRPASLPAAEARRLERLGTRVYQCLGLSGYARIDLRLRADGEPFVLEANPNPDVSRADDFARSAAAAGIGYADLVDRILRLGIAYHAAWYQ